MPVPRRRPPERWRGGWPREFWDPFGEFGQLWERMGQFFESTGQSGAGAWVATVETEEADDAYLVRAELPGMKRDDVDVELSGHELRITGEVKEEPLLRSRRYRACPQAAGDVCGGWSPERPYRASGGWPPYRLRWVR